MSRYSKNRTSCLYVKEEMRSSRNHRCRKSLEAVLVMYSYAWVSSVTTLWLAWCVLMFWTLPASSTMNGNASLWMRLPVAVFDYVAGLAPRDSAQVFQHAAEILHTVQVLPLLGGIVCGLYVWTLSDVEQSPESIGKFAPIPAGHHLSKCLGLSVPACANGNTVRH